jgi:hypothetical protein
MSLSWLIVGNVFLYACNGLVLRSLDQNLSWQYFVSIAILIAAQAWAAIYTGSNVSKNRL